MKRNKKRIATFLIRENQGSKKIKKTERMEKKSSLVCPDIVVVRSSNSVSALLIV